jgi:hypothetical protein
LQRIRTKVFAELQFAERRTDGAPSSGGISQSARKSSGKTPAARAMLNGECHGRKWITFVDRKL